MLQSQFLFDAIFSLDLNVVYVTSVVICYRTSGNVAVITNHASSDKTCT